MLLDSINMPSNMAVAVGPGMLAAPPTMIEVSGATLLVALQGTSASATAALNTLRAFRTIGRRLAWCQVSDLARSSASELRDWGRRLVQDGGVGMLVTHGAGGRDLALGARDAGLALGRAVVCRDEATARNILGDSIAAGDTALVLGIGAEACQRLIDRLESRLAREPALPA
jgi:hypothetical protein